MNKLEEVLEILKLRYEIQKEGDVTKAILVPVQVENVEFTVIPFYHENFKAYSFVVQLLDNFQESSEFAKELAYRSIFISPGGFYPYGRIQIAKVYDGENFLVVNAFLPEEAINQYNVDVVIKCVSGVATRFISTFEELVPEEKRAMFKPTYEHTKKEQTA